MHRDPLFGRTVRRFFDLWTERADLAHLDERMLQDIGISRADAAAEALRAPWDIPPARRFDDGRSEGGGIREPRAMRSAAVAQAARLL